MRDDTQSELLNLIRNEINLGFTFMETYHLASSAEHSAQALSGAQASLRTAKKFLEKLTEAEARAFEPDLQKLESVIASAEKASTQY